MSLERSRVNELRATAHPLRLQMLSLLTGAALSAAEVARELDITQANASYHLRFLQDAGLVTVVSEERIRGGLAKRYRHVWDAQTTTAAGATEEDRLAYIRTLAGAIPARYPERRKGEPTLFTDADLWVDPEVWDEVFDLVKQASELIHAKAKPPRSRGTVRANLSVAAFRLKRTGKGAR